MEPSISNGTQRREYAPFELGVLRDFGYDLRCGNGILDAGESCDPAMPGTRCCNGACDGAVVADTPCRGLADVCDVAETCDGLDDMTLDWTSSTTASSSPRKTTSASGQVRMVVYP